MDHQEIEVKPCSTCNGSGNVILQNGSQVCFSCGGSGAIGTDGEIDYLIQFDPVSKHPRILGVRPKFEEESQKTPLSHLNPPSTKGILNTVYLMIFVMILVVTGIAYLIFPERQQVLWIGGSVIGGLICLIILIKIPKNGLFHPSIFSDPHDFVDAIKTRGKSMKP